GNNGGQYRYVLPSTQSELYVSFGFAQDTLPAANLNSQICSFNDGSNNVVAALYCQSDGSIALTKGSNTIIATTQGPVITSRNWAFLEMYFDGNGDTFVLRINDTQASNTPAISASSTGWSTGTIAQMTFISAVGGAAGVPWMDDLFIRNSSGTT